MYRYIPFILSLGIVFFLILSFLPIRIYIFFKIYEDNQMRIHAETLFGLIRYHTKIDLMDRLFDREEGFYLKSNLFKKIVLSGFRREYEHYEKKRRNIFSILDYLQKRIKIQSLLWRTQFGIGDAAATGIMSGVFWAFKGCLLSMIQNYFVSKKINIYIEPQFDKNFGMNIDCIIRIKIDHIMTGYYSGLFIV